MANMTRIKILLICRFLIRLSSGVVMKFRRCTMLVFMRKIPVLRLAILLNILSLSVRVFRVDPPSHHFRGAPYESYRSPCSVVD